MKENPEFIGRAYAEEEKGNLNEVLKKWSNEESEPVEGELEKTEEEIKMIETVNLIIESELKSLGIEEYRPIPLARVHMLPGEVFREKFPDSEASGFFFSTNDAVYLNKDSAVTKARMLSVLTHELVHRASATKFYVDNDKGIHDARVGYRIRSPWKEPARPGRLRGFNELMTDLTVYKVLVNNQELLESRIGLAKKDIQGPIYTYTHYESILEPILKKISEDKQVSPKEAFDNLERGQFENNILALKDVEKSFGKGSLEILSLLEALKEKDDNDKLEGMIRGFFSEQDELERQNIRYEILAFVDKVEKGSQAETG
ncbi:MAG TPA: hypothetical protein VEB60_01425 [Candidatus Paceibacterota bacterium]|nr:hypothetical protein [Candidatus Paceibacterota bacterium]